MLLERLISDRPQFHYFKRQGIFESWAIHPDALRFLHSLLVPGMRTFETGCGHTTVTFAIAGTTHVCITPKSDETERVTAYCESLGLDANTTFIVGSSDEVLPRGEQIPDDLDLVFIDGAHGFPAPIIDWYYTSEKIANRGCRMR